MDDNVQPKLPSFQNHLKSWLLPSMIDKYHLFYELLVIGSCVISMAPKRFLEHFDKQRRMEYFLFVWKNYINCFFFCQEGKENGK